MPTACFPYIAPEKARGVVDADIRLMCECRGLRHSRKQRRARPPQ